MSGTGKHTRGSSAMAARGLNGPAKRNMSETQTKAAKSLEGKSLNNPGEITQAAREVLGARSAYVKRSAAADKAAVEAGKAYTDYTHPNGSRYPMHTSTMQNDPQYRSLRQASDTASRAADAAQQAMLQAADKRVGGALSQAWDHWNRGETTPSLAKPAGAKSGGAKAKAEGFSSPQRAAQNARATAKLEAKSAGGAKATKTEGAQLRQELNKHLAALGKATVEGDHAAATSARAKITEVADKISARTTARRASGGTSKTAKAAKAEQVTTATSVAKPKRVRRATASA